MTDHESGAQYDPETICKYAKKLLNKANSIVRVHVMVGVLLSIVAFVMIPLDNVLFKGLGAEFVRRVFSSI